MLCHYPYNILWHTQVYRVFYLHKNNRQISLEICLVIIPNSVLCDFKLLVTTRKLCYRKDDRAMRAI